MTVEGEGSIVEVAIPKSLEALVRRKVEKGHYTTEPEVVADALRLMLPRPRSHGPGHPVGRG